MRPNLAVILCLISTVGWGAEPAATAPALVGTVAETAEDARALATGQHAPLQSHVLRPDGTTTTLQAETAGRPTVVVFYRGGWCPFCTRQLAGLGSVQAELERSGWRILALSPEPAAVVAMTISTATANNGHDGIRRLADADGNAMRAFGVAFHLDETASQRVRARGTILVTPPGSPRGILPVPSLFLVDATGVIRFVHADPDYRTRISTEAVRAAALAITPPATP